MTIRTMGSVAYKLARVASGQCDATWSRDPSMSGISVPVCYWCRKRATWQSIWSNRPITFNNQFVKANGIIADNGYLHDAIVAALAPYGAARKEKGLTY